MTDITECKQRNYQTKKNKKNRRFIGLIAS